MKQATLAALALAAVLPSGAGAQPFTGADLQKSCATPATAQVCIAYMRGAVSMYEAVVAEAKDVVWFCPPVDGDPAALRKLYLDWAQENPAGLAQPAMGAVKAMLQDAFACSD